MQTVLVAIRCWWKIATPIGLVLAVAAGAAVYLVTEPTYTAQVWFIIKAQRESPLFRDEQQHVNPLKVIANHTELMKSPPIVDPVAGNPAVFSTPEIAREPDPTAAIKRQVRIRGLSTSDYFVMEFTSTVPEKAALVVNELSKSYFSYQSRDAIMRSSAMIKLLEDQMTAQKSKVEDLRKRWKETALSSSGIDPFAIKPNEQTIHVQNPYAELQAQLLKIQLEHLTLTVQVQYLESAAAQQKPIDPTPWELDQMVNNDPAILKLRAQIEMLEPKVLEYREKAANPDKNVGLQQLEKELKDDQAKLTKLEADLRPKLKEQLVQMAKQQQASELEGLKQNLAANDLMQTVVKEKLEGKISDQKVFREKSFDEEVLRTEYESALELFDAIKAKIDAMRMNQAYPDPIEIFKEASVPLRPDEALPFKKMGMASLAAFLLPFALAAGIEFLYRRVSSRDQLEQGGKIMVVGEVTTLPRRARRDASAKGSPNRELQLFEESIDGLRTYLSLVQSLQGMRVLAVASSISREGKTSLASQLAVSIASSTGEPTLLIDGDLRSPDIHRIFDVDRGPGVVEVLQGKSTLDEAIETGFSRKLHLLTAGQLDVSPHRILGSGEFTALIENLKGTYRHIVIDTPPILAASEALVMARTADATILCVRRDFSRIDQVQEAYARLQGAGVKTAGAVLNGIPSRAYAYRYGSYYYDRARHDRVSVDSGAVEDVAASA